MAKQELDEFTDQQHEVLKSIRISKIILPILIGIAVVIYLVLQQFDPEEFAKIEWTDHLLFWTFLSMFLLLLRHMAYAFRLRVLSDEQFSWRKCIELIFIWEFSSAVSPTSVGGSAVALFVLSQEKLSGAKTTTIVVYSAVLDTIFFISTLPLLYWFIGPSIIRPGLKSITDFDGWGYTFVGAYIFMAIYGSVFYYGLLINPRQIKRLVVGFTKLGFLKKYRKSAIELGDDIVITSKELWQKKWTFHISAFLATATAWSCRFLLLNCLIIAFVKTTPMDFFSQFALYARLEAMFVIMAFSPTPGGAGLAEIVFNGFLYDYVPQGISIIIATIWRLLTYYFYLIAGAIIIPNWIRGLLNERKKRKLQE